MRNYNAKNERIKHEYFAYLKHAKQRATSTISNEEIAELTPPQKQTVRLLLNNLVDNYGAWPKKEDANAGTN